MKLYTKIHNKTALPAEFIQDQSLTELHFDYNITIESDVIKINIKNKTESNTTVFSAAIPFSVIKTHPSYAAQGFWCIPDSIVDTIIGIDKGEYFVNTQDKISSIYTESYVSKLSPLNPVAGYQKCPVILFVPSISSTIDDIEFIINLHPSTYEDDNITKSFTYSINSADSADVTVITTIKELIKPITVVASQTTTAPGDLIDLTVSADPIISEIFVESIVGISNKIRIPLVNGSGKVSILTQGLETGDTVRIKFGHKYFTAVNNFTRILT